MAKRRRSPQHLETRKRMRRAEQRAHLSAALDARRARAARMGLAR